MSPKLVISLLIVVLCGCLDFVPIKASNEMPDHILIQFLDKGKYIWIFRSRDNLQLEFNGNFKHEQFSKIKQSHYVVIGTGTISYGESKMDVTAQDVSVNGINMGEAINAVIDRDNKVHMGAFIRTFD